MNAFFDYIQPTIVKTTNHKDIPENLRGKYFVNFNVFGIQYFIENFILTENEYGTPYLIMKEDSWNFLLEDSNTNNMIVDVPRLYIAITPEFINDPQKVFQSFIYQATMQNSIYAVGIDNFMAGEDYFLNTTLYNYLANSDQITIPNFGARLPNYLDDDNDDGVVHIKSEYWEDLTQSVYNDYKNLNYYYNRNKLLDNTYSEEELNNFYSTFCKIILKYTEISDSKKADSTNQIYELVLNYYKNFQNDEIYSAVNLVLNSLYASSTTSTCGCTTGINDETTTTTDTSCASLYGQAMELYLQQMLADKQFYKDWFSIEITETGKTLVNEVLIENLILFITEFKEMDAELDFSEDTNDCSCGVVSDNHSDCNYKIIENYLRLLNWVRNDELDENTNKIKIFGKQFAEILPNMQF